MKPRDQKSDGMSATNWRFSQFGSPCLAGGFCFGARRAQGKRQIDYFVLEQWGEVAAESKTSGRRVAGQFDCGSIVHWKTDRPGRIFATWNESDMKLDP